MKPLIKMFFLALFLVGGVAYAENESNSSTESPSEATSPAMPTMEPWDESREDHQKIKEMMDRW